MLKTAETGAEAVEGGSWQTVELENGVLEQGRNIMLHSDYTESQIQWINFYPAEAVLLNQRWEAALLLLS